MKAKREVALYILMFNMFIAMTGIGLIIPIMPSVLNSFGLGGQALGLMIAAFSFAQFIFSPLAGDLSDRYGRKKIIITGLLLFSSSQLIFGLSDVVWLLYVSRIIGGLGSAFMVPAMMAYVADITSYENRGKGMGQLGASMSLGFVIGPGIGGFLASLGLRAPFFIAALVSAIAAIISFLLLPEVHKAQEVKQNELVHQKRDNLLKQMALSVKKSYFILLIIMFTLSFGLANFQSTISLYVDHKFSFSPMDISILMIVGGLIGVIMQSFFINPLFVKFGELSVMNTTLILSAITMLMILLARGFWSVLIISTFFFISTSMLRPAINTLISKMAGKEQGFAAGMNNAYMSIGNMIGPALAGILFDVNMNYPYIFGALIILISFFISFYWSKQFKKKKITATT